MAASMCLLCSRSKNVLTKASVGLVLKLSSRAITKSHTLNKGLVLGVYLDNSGEDLLFSDTAKGYNDRFQNKIISSVTSSRKVLEKGKVRVLHGIDNEFTTIAVACIGSKNSQSNKLEMYDERKERIKTAVSRAVNQLKRDGESEIEVDHCGDSEAAAEGANLGLFTFDELKAKKSNMVQLQCSTEFVSDSSSVVDGWNRGCILAEGQNFSRRLKEMPPNILTPTKFGQIVQEKFSNFPKCKVTVHDKAWAESKKMYSFLSVSQGSEQPPVFLEIDYNGGASDQNPVALVGKGVTFDTGGISIKPSAGMDAMRGDMGGAACVVGTLLAINKLNMPINIKAFIPLCENMPSGRATRPGDVVTAMNGKTIQVDNTDAEGRLILADALCYSTEFKPKLILDMATLTGAMSIALGAGVTGVFTNSPPLFSLLEQAGCKTGDRVWRMPLLEYYSKKIRKSQLADLNNIGASKGAGACIAAAFLQEFVDDVDWLHLDIAGVMSESDAPYVSKGMSGRPTRTVIEFIQLLSDREQSMDKLKEG